ncbi:hypothetical protein D3C86_866050 [compost metagenome]
MLGIFTSIALFTLAGLILFQIALIFGAPLGRYAWGGGNKVLPTRLRIASVTSIALYVVFAVFIANKAGLVDFISRRQVLDIGMWVFTVYFFIGIGMNVLSRSKPERYLMTPVAGILAVSFLVVTLA